MSKEKKILLSGTQPSGKLHVGNYLGAMKQFIAFQDEYESYISIVNYHALTSVQDASRLKEETMQAAIDHLAIGLDPEKVTLFVQSDVPQVTELTWIFNTLITVPYLSRAVAYKDKVAQGLEATVGLFDYPVLMAADILLPGASIVPVGADQKQHVEIARDIALKFNTTYGETFIIPEAFIQKEVAIIPGIDGRKMSKSYNNTIPLFALDEELEKAVMSIVTDSKGVDEPKDPENCNVFALHKHFSQNQLSELEERYRKGGLGYQESKQILLKNIKELTGSMREKRAKLEKDRDFVLEILRKGASVASERAEKKMQEVREKIGATL